MPMGEKYHAKDESYRDRHSASTVYYTKVAILFLRTDTVAKLAYVVSVLLEPAWLGQREPDHAGAGRPSRHCRAALKA